MKKYKYIILIIVCIMTIFFFPLIWTIIGFLISFFSRFNFFVRIQTFVTSYSFINKSQYIDYSSTLLCILTSSVLGYAAFKLSSKSVHYSNVKMALFIKHILVESVNVIFKLYHQIPTPKIEIPKINFFEHEFTFLTNEEIELIYNLYLKIINISYLQEYCSADAIVGSEKMPEIAAEILNDIFDDIENFKYKNDFQKILDKANKYFNK